MISRGILFEMSHLFFPFFVYHVNILGFLLFFLLLINFFHLFFKILVIQPCNSFSMLPQPCSFYLVYIFIYSLAMLLTVLPLSSILSSILPRIYTEPMLFILLVFTFVSSSIRPAKYSLSMHVSFLPLT